MKRFARLLEFLFLARSPAAWVALTLTTTLAATHSALAQYDDVVITLEPVAPSIYMLTGQGGNMGLSVGDDATFLIDDQFAPLTEKIVAAVGTVSDRPVDYVLNTHWHGDHTGGNENLGKEGALILAHDKVRTRMAEGMIRPSGRVAEPAPPSALPVITFGDTLTLHLNGHTIRGIHTPQAHTDGDIIVFFAEANVMHMGDTFFNGWYPFIDTQSGGTVDGLIEAAETALAIADEKTRIIPGHGPLSTRQDLQTYRDMLVTMRARVQSMIDEGMSLDEILAAKPSADFDATANRLGTMAPERFIGAIHASL